MCVFVDKIRALSCLAFFAIRVVELYLQRTALPFARDDCFRHVFGVKVLGTSVKWFVQSQKVTEPIGRAVL